MEQWVQSQMHLGYAESWQRKTKVKAQIINKDWVVLTSSKLKQKLFWKLNYAAEYLQVSQKAQKYTESLFVAWCDDEAGRFFVITSSWRLWASSHRPRLLNHWLIAFSSQQGTLYSSENKIGRDVDYRRPQTRLGITQIHLVLLSLLFMFCEWQASTTVTVSPSMTYA